MYCTIPGNEDVLGLLTGSVDSANSIIPVVIINGGRMNFNVENYNFNFRFFSIHPLTGDQQ